MPVEIMTLHERLTWSKPNGEWGLGDVDLSKLPPAVYGALYKLKRYEDELAQLRNVSARTERKVELWL